MDSRLVEIKFPLGGESRSERYTQNPQAQVYFSPRAINVRGRGALERRVRGGTRPGLSKYLDTGFGTTITGIAKVTYLNASDVLSNNLVVISGGTLYVCAGATVTTSKSYLTDDSGNKIITDDGKYMIFGSTVAVSNSLITSGAFQMAEGEGKLYIADSSLLEYNPRTNVVDTIPTAPTSQPLICIYQRRVVLTGSNHIFYMSRQTDPTDWDLNDDMNDVGRALIGHVGTNNAIGEKINGMLPWDDKAILFGTNRSLTVIYGNPADSGSRMETVSENVGVLGPNCMCVTPEGVVFFLAREGLYTWQMGSKAEPESLSRNRVPEELLDIDLATTSVMMIYDHRSKGVHLFKTPLAATAGKHWFIDIENKGMWEVVFASNTHQPLAVASLAMTGYSDVILGCKDGYLRRFDSAVTGDDSTDFKSDILIGPLHVSGALSFDGQIQEMVADFADNTGSITWRLVTGNTAEEATDKAETDLDAGTTTNVEASGTWSENHNIPDYPRARGAWAILWITSTKKWSYEAITMKMLRHGRIR